MAKVLDAVVTMDAILLLTLMGLEFSKWLLDRGERRLREQLALRQMGRVFRYLAAAIEAEPELARIRARLAVAEWRASSRPMAQA